MKHSVLVIVLLATATGLTCLQQTSSARQPTLRTEKLESDPQPLPQRAALKLPLKNPQIVVTKSKRR